MLTEKQSQFWETEKPIDTKTSLYLQKALLNDEKVRYTFRGYGCFSFFTDRRVIFINSPEASPLSDEIQFLPYHSLQRYGIVVEKTGIDANVELYITEFLPFRFYFSNCDEAFKLVELLGDSTR